MMIKFHNFLVTWLTLLRRTVNMMIEKVISRRCLGFKHFIANRARKNFLNILHIFYKGLNLRT